MTKFPIDQYKVETDQKKAFRYRLRHTPSNRVTDWASYVSVVMLDDVVACTQFYASADQALKPLSAADFVQIFAVLESKSRSKAKVK